MITHIDERNGLVKTSWQHVRKRVNAVAPEFSKIIDTLSPDKNFPLYLAYYRYGDLKGDTISPFLPKLNGDNYRLSDPDAPSDVIKQLGYGSNSSPLGMVLEKQLEYFIDLKDLQMTIPWQVYPPGSFFPLTRVLQSKGNRIYTPNGLLTAVSGARSIFMLPKIGCQTNHLMLKRQFNVQSKAPKSLYEHWYLFKDIIKSHQSCEWRSCILYFSKKWVEKIHNDKAWYPLKKFLLELAWTSFEYERNHIYYNIAYSLIQKKRNLKPNPYLVDTACHLFTIALGAVPGYAPATNNEALPFEFLQEVFVDFYGMKKYIPTIMEPAHFYLEDDFSKQVYYSLQYPTSISFSPKSRKLSSTIFEMLELNHIMKIFIAELNNKNNIFSDTIINDVAKRVDFSFFHNITDKHKIIQHSNNIINFDDRFNSKHASKSAPSSTFASDSPFVRGCISIGIKN